MSIDGFNPYEVLKIPYGSSQKTARTAAFKLIKELHPDKGGNDDDYVRINN